jgi:two-component system sensor histidine kinase BaeS
LRAADRATRRIAAGDLDVRVDVPKGQDELAQLAVSVNSMAESLGRSRERERNFLLSVSHDLRTPLTSIRGWAEAIADGTAADPAPAAEVIVEQTVLLGRLVEDLLELAKLDARQLSLRPVALELGEEVHRAASRLEPGRRDHGIALRVESEAGVHVEADPDRLGQIVGNLVENAGKYARARVVVRITSRDAFAVIEVEDDGPGITVADLPNVFDRLYAGRRADRGPVPSGLGLAIVAELVDAMGGLVSADSPPGKGAVLTVRLPRSSG